MFAVHNVANGFDRFVQAIFGVDDDIVKFFDAEEFFAGHGDAEVEVFVGFGLAGAEAADEFVFIAGGEEDEDCFGTQAADSGRALHVQAHDHVFSTCEGFAHLGFGDALVVVVDVGVFEEFVFFDHVGKFGMADEEVVYAVPLGRAFGARGGGDDEMEGQAALLHFGQHGVFAHAGRAGDDDE